MTAVREALPHGRLAVVLGTMQDKDVSGILDALVGAISAYLLVALGWAVDNALNEVFVNRGGYSLPSYDAGVAVFTIADGGLMAEATIGGQQFSYEPRRY